MRAPRRWIAALLTQLLIIPYSLCIQCYTCVSQFGGLEAGLKLRLQRQSVFFPPPSGFDAACHLPAAAQPNPRASICAEPACLTLTPQIDGVNFTLRGCVEQVLRHSFRSDRALGPGCHSLHAPDSFGADFPDPLRLVACVCDHDFCNAQGRPAWRHNNDHEGIEIMVADSESSLSAAILEASASAAPAAASFLASLASLLLFF